MSEQNNKGFKGISSLTSRKDEEEKDSRIKKEKTTSHDNVKRSSVHDKKTNVDKDKWTGEPIWGGYPGPAGPSGERKAIFILLTIIALVIFIANIDFNKTTTSRSTSSYNSTSNPSSNKPYSKPTNDKKIKHVTASSLNVRSRPDSSATKIGKLDKYHTVKSKTSEKNSNWDEITINGMVGYVYNKYLALGSGETGIYNACKQAGITRPYSGQVFYQASHGKHALTVKNDQKGDAIAKLKDINDGTVLSFFIRSGSTAVINDVPEGSYKFQYATGKEYSPKCGYFLKDMHASADNNFTEYKTSRVGQYIYTSSMTYTLYRVAGGNFTPKKISNNEF